MKGNEQQLLKHVERLGKTFTTNHWISEKFPIQVLQ
jgi:hypothetical protein